MELQHMEWFKVAESLGFTAKGVKASKSEDIFSEFPKLAIAHVLMDGSLLHYIVIHYYKSATFC